MAARPDSLRHLLDPWHPVVPTALPRVVRLIVGVVARSAVLVGLDGAALAYAATRPASTATAIDTGLTLVVVVAATAFTWAAIDGVRTGPVAGVLAWGLTAVLAGVGAGLVSAMWADGTPGSVDRFLVWLVAAPALAGLVLAVLARWRDGVPSATRQH